jgi:hypothetical protein
MESIGSDEMVPPNNKGSSLDTEFEVRATDESEAKKLFALASHRLLDVNSWDKLCGPMSAVFKLTDRNGIEINGLAKPGDHFQIDVPGPGPAAGEGFDWVRIEAMDDQRNPSAREESVTLRVRPSSSPKNKNPDTAHFFSEDATSSFRVARIGTVVRAEVHGRNETPNTETTSAVDKVRNAVVGTGASAGMSTPQWNSLVKGLLNTSK